MNKRAKRGRTVITKLYEVLKDGEWHTFSELYTAVGAGSRTGMAARIRDLRKPRYGGYIIRTKYTSGRGDAEFQLERRTPEPTTSAPAPVVRIIPPGAKADDMNTTKDTTTDGKPTEERDTRTTLTDRQKYLLYKALDEKREAIKDMDISGVIRLSEEAVGTGLTNSIVRRAMTELDIDYKQRPRSTLNIVDMRAEVLALRAEVGQMRTALAEMRKSLGIE